MSSRKETPDLLGELLGEAPPFQRPPAAKRGNEAKLPTVETPKPPSPTATRAKESPKRKPASSARRPVWEYLELTIHDYRGWRPRCIDGHELRDWKDGPSLRDYLDHLGAEGWEMTGILEAGRGERNVYFKRPRE